MSDHIKTHKKGDITDPAALASASVATRTWSFGDLWNFGDQVVRLYNPEGPVIIFGHVGFKPDKHPALDSLIRDFNATCEPLIKAVGKGARDRGSCIVSTDQIGINFVNGPWTCPEYTVLGMYSGFLVSKDFVDSLDKEKQTQFNTGYSISLDSDDQTICGENAYIDGHPFMFWNGDTHLVDNNAAYINSVCEQDNTSFVYAARMNKEDSCESKKDCIRVLDELGLSGIFDGKSDDFMRLLIFAITSEDVPKFASFVLRYSIDPKVEVYWMKRKIIETKPLAKFEEICDCKCRLLEHENQKDRVAKFKYLCPLQMARIQDKRLKLDYDVIKRALDALKSRRLDQNESYRKKTMKFYTELNASVNIRSRPGSYEIITGAFGFTNPKINDGRFAKAFNKRVQPLCDAIEKKQQELEIVHMVDEHGTLKVFAGKNPIKQGTPLFIGCGSIGFSIPSNEQDYFIHELPERIDGHECYINSYSTMCGKYPHTKINGFTLRNSCRRFNVNTIDAADRDTFVMSRDASSNKEQPQAKVRTTRGENELLDHCFEKLGLAQEYSDKPPYLVLPLVLFVASEDISPMAELCVRSNTRIFKPQRACKDIIESLDLPSDQIAIACKCEHPFTCPSKAYRIESRVFEDPVRESNLRFGRELAEGAAENDPQAPGSALGVNENESSDAAPASAEFSARSMMAQSMATPGVHKHGRDEDASPPEAPARKQQAAEGNIEEDDSDVNDHVIFVGFSPPRPGTPPRSAPTAEEFVDLLSSPDDVDPVETIDGAGPAAAASAAQGYDTESDSDIDQPAVDIDQPAIDIDQPAVDSALPEAAQATVPLNDSEGVLPPSNAPTNAGGARNTTRITKGQLIINHTAEAFRIDNENNKDYEAFMEVFRAVSNERREASAKLDEIQLLGGTENARERILLPERIKAMDERLRVLNAIKELFDHRIIGASEFRLSRRKLRTLSPAEIQRLIQNLFSFRYSPRYPGDGRPEQPSGGSGGFGGV